MNKYSYILILFFSLAGNAQVGNYNQFPTLPPAHLLDDENLLEDISFAYSMRILESDYAGPLLRLRRASDGAEEDFYCNALDKVDTAAIDNWRNGSNVFIVRWYDQSGQSRDAIQTINTRQPRFYPDIDIPHFAGDGADDSLIVQGTFNDVIQNGKNGTVTGVFFAIDRADSAFGGIDPSNGRDRWLVHINWSDEHFYFDPGYCCNNPRRFRNDVPTSTNGPGRLGVWGQYSLIRRDNPASASIDRIILRLQSEEKVNGDFPDNRAFSRTNFPFLLGALSRDTFGNSTSAATTKFAEMIMYNRGKSDDFVLEIEENQINFWEI